MLIVCPNCSTSYMIEPTSLGAAGRTVRCARCKSTWFADGSKSEPEMSASADGGSEGAENQFSVGVLRSDRAPDSHAESGLPAVESAAAGSVASSAPVSDPADIPSPEPVAAVDAPSLVPPIDPSAISEANITESDTDEIENFEARRKRLQAKRKKKRRSSRWTALILVLFAFNVALIGARGEVVRFLPQTASLFAAVGFPVNLRHLKFDNMRISKEAQEGLSALIIEGNIISITNKPIEVPRLRFAARDTTGQEIYTWTALPSRSILGPGEQLEFRSRLVSPPANAVDVMVRFFNAQDATAAAK